MEVRAQLMADLKTAMRSGDKETRDAIRMLQAAIKQVEIDGGKKLDDKGVTAVLQTQAKRRREAIVEYEKANRPELAAVEQGELVIIERYLPQMLDRDQIAAIAAPIIAELGVTDMRGMGAVMGRLMGQLKGKADGRLVNQVVRGLIQNQ